MYLVVKAHYTWMRQYGFIERLLSVASIILIVTFLSATGWKRKIFGQFGGLGNWDQHDLQDRCFRSTNPFCKRYITFLRDFYCYPIVLDVYSNSILLLSLVVLSDEIQLVMWIRIFGKKKECKYCIHISLCEVMIFILYYVMII